MTMTEEEPKVTIGGAKRGSGTRVFIGQAPGGRSRGLNDDVKDEDLRTHFERYGTVTGIAQHRWEDTNKKKGFGYIEFAEFEAAQAALGIHTISGVGLEVKLYTAGGAGRSQNQVGPGAVVQHTGMKRSFGGGFGGGYGGGRGNTTRVFIGQAPGGRSRGLNDDIKDEHLRTHFERYGTVTGIAQHKWEDSGKKKGFGYIEFAEYEAAQAALGIHHVEGVALEVKMYQQGGGRNQPQAPGAAAPVSTYGSGDYGYGGWGYGADNKRPRMDGAGGAQSSAAMMEQMKSMMVQMQQMQQQIQGGGGGMSEQLQQMQQTMYSMMQYQYMSALGGSAANGAGYSSTNPYQYPTASYDYSKSTPKPPGTDRY